MSASAALPDQPKATPLASDTLWSPDHAWNLVDRYVKGGLTAYARDSFHAAVSCFQTLHGLEAGAEVFYVANTGLITTNAYARFGSANTRLISTRDDACAGHVEKRGAQIFATTDIVIAHAELDAVLGLGTIDRPSYFHPNHHGAQSPPQSYYCARRERLRYLAAQGISTGVPDAASADAHDWASYNAQPISTEGWGTSGGQGGDGGLAASGSNGEWGSGAGWGSGEGWDDLPSSSLAEPSSVARAVLQIAGCWMLNTMNTKMLNRAKRPVLHIYTTPLVAGDDGYDDLPDLISVAPSTDDERPPWLQTMEIQQRQLPSPRPGADADLQRGEYLVRTDGEGVERAWAESAPATVVSSRTLVAGTRNAKRGHGEGKAFPGVEDTTEVIPVGELLGDSILLGEVSVRRVGHFRRADGAGKPMFEPEAHAGIAMAMATDIPRDRGLSRGARAPLRARLRMRLRSALERETREEDDWERRRMPAPAAGGDLERELPSRLVRRPLFANRRRTRSVSDSRKVGAVGGVGAGGRPAATLVNGPGGSGEHTLNAGEDANVAITIWFAGRHLRSVHADIRADYGVLKRVLFRSRDADMASANANRGRRKRNRSDISGELHIHSSSYATNYNVSANGRVYAETSLLDTSAPALPTHFGEDLQTSAAIESADFSYLCGDDGSWDDEHQLLGPDDLEHGDDDDGIHLRMGNSELPSGGQEAGPVLLERVAGCGSAMYCERCIAELHRNLPTHMLEKWSGEFFRPVTVGDLDAAVRIQLGHPAGTFCPATKPAHKDFVIMDTLGIRVVKLNFCGCDSDITHRQQLMRACLWPATSLDPQTCATFNVIRLFEVQNCLGKISAYDFVRSLELLSSNDGLSPPPDRRRAFRAIVRQYRMMEMLKRAGRGHDDTGTRGTKQGELALPCRACPQPGMNLPEGWDKIDWDSMDEDQRYVNWRPKDIALKSSRYKYFLQLSQDANFKLINRNVSTEQKDPVIDDGAGYFCNRAEYAEHIRKHVDEEEISSCSGFQAMFLANAKRVKGLRVTGVGGVTCARHNMWRPNGIGDLQFSKHIWTRMEGLPAKFHLKMDPANVRWMVPNFHLAAHKKGCHSPFSFHWLWGAGRTHGETVEQNWEFLNGIAASTKLMGVGARYTALEGLFAFHNWRRLVAHRRILKQRMAEGIVDGKVHKEAFQAFHDALSQMDGVDLSAWRVWVDQWEKSQHVENEKNSPYKYEEEGQTLKEIRLRLAAEEYARTGNGEEVEREDTPSTFITMGMEIEEVQRQLAVAIKAAGPVLSTSQELDFLKRRSLLRGRIQGFRRLQKTYMPNLRRYLSASQKLMWDADDKQPEATRLFMPSDIATTEKRVKACAAGLDGVEARLRHGEAGEGLGQLRQGLRTRTMTNKFKIRNWSGQRALTRGQGILRQINIKVHAAKLRYRYARQALLKLKGHGDWEKRYRVLEDDDVRALNERSLRDEEQAQDIFLGALGTAAGPSATGAVALGEGHRTLSWIWYESSTATEGDEKMHEALRVEYCKAYSRAHRWREDLVTVEEEMRRTIEFGRFAQRQWRERAGARTRKLAEPSKVMDAALLEGVRAYALEQADRETRTCEMLERDWAPLRARAAAYLDGRDMSSLPPVVVDVDPDQLRWAEATAYSTEEAENDMYQ
ncbi:hypothetical protein B0H11DRAFT_1930374 [Mycena galericulata]|nr:hypothetical protein B0H11DRAFT_1930374 [Mycena galericulata]